MQGRFADAVRVNPAGVVVVLTLAWFGVRAIVAVLRRRRVKRLTLTLPSTRPAQAALAIAVGVCWVIRMHAPANLVGG